MFAVSQTYIISSIIAPEKYPRVGEPARTRFITIRYYYYGNSTELSPCGRTSKLSSSQIGGGNKGTVASPAGALLAMVVVVEFGVLGCRTGGAGGSEAGRRVP
jgi:hypothetical protein